jgi:hypothetical protein
MLYYKYMELQKVTISTISFYVILERTKGCHSLTFAYFYIVTSDEHMCSYVGDIFA